jgi:hypothetical protein
MPSHLKDQLQNLGCTKEMIEELWKWYDPMEKKGVASF